MYEILLPIAIIVIIGLALGVMLVVAARFMAVKVDETFEQLRAELPGVNCGACGYVGCDDYAKALAAGGVEANLCIPGGVDCARKLSGILGVSVADVKEQYAVVCCSASSDNTDYCMDYKGPQTCAACNSFYQGRRTCSHACLGLGDCVGVCEYDALHIINGVAVIDPLACTGCGMCARTCPNELIRVIPRDSKVFVACSSNDKGAYVRKVCKAGCIGCRICEKACEYSAITVNGNLALIDSDKCTNCGVCVAKCPAKVIHFACQS